MTLPKDGRYIPDSDRWPGLRRHTPIPSSLSGQLYADSMEVVQSYKGHAVLECRKCLACTVVEVVEDADWSCWACSQRAFGEVYPGQIRDGRAVYISTSTPTAAQYRAAA